MKIIQLVSHQDKLYALGDDGILYEKKQFSYDAAFSAWVKVLSSEDVAEPSDIAHKHHEIVSPTTLNVGITEATQV